MNKKAIVFAVAAACLTSGAAFAQSYDYRNDRNDGYQRGVQYERQDRNHDGYVDRSERRVSAHRDYRERRDYRDYRDGRSRDSYRSDRHYRSGQVYGQVYSTNQYGRVVGNSQYGQPSYYQMRRGERLANQYRSQRYVVSDWRSHRLHQPQYGHHWVQAGNDYALVAIATGIIAQVLMNH